MTQHPLGATCASPRGSQPTLGFCIAATAKQVLLGYKKALGGGQAGSRAAGIHARALAVATGLHVRANNAICPGIAAQRTPQQRPKPQTRGHGAELASQRLPERSRAAPPHAESVPHAAVPNGRAWHRHRHGFSQFTQFPRPRPRAVLGREAGAASPAAVSPRGANILQMPFCFTKQPRVL